jgi:hypothetical protein
VPKTLPCFQQKFSPRFTLPRPTKTFAGWSLTFRLIPPCLYQPHKKGRSMKLYTQAQYEQLIKNGQNRRKDHYPVIKLFMPGTAHTWLITELDPEEPDLAFGLCDLGMGFPELGYVSIDEISSVKNAYGLGVERDLYFEAKYPISVYANAARSCESITEDDAILSRYVKKKPPGYTPS